MKTTFDEKYEYIDNDPIRRGAFGDILRIRDKKVKTEYVLKKLIKEDPNNKNIKGTDKETFENELNFLMSVKGTNILNIIDYYNNPNDKYYYLILEKMDGDLSMMLNENKNGMSSNLIRKIFSQINSGLKIMINKGKTHRDLKPENILFSYTNDKKDDFIVKIGDFGLSTDLRSTKVASIAGTELFRAPEIEEGIYSNKCDLYSIGIILYMLKTGEYIFEGKKLVDILNNQRNNKIKKETDDEKLNKLIKKLVVYEPHERMKWKDYFDDPFFNENEENNNKDSEGCKI
jgi:serine/threonine protein kinase